MQLSLGWLSLLLWTSVGSCLLSRDMMKRAQSMSKDGVLEIEDSTFDRVFNGPRDYWLIVMFTAVKVNVGCEACTAFYPMYRSVSRSFIANYPDNNRVFFAEADFGDNGDHFRALKMNTVPHIWIYPPTELSEAEVSVIDPADYESYVNVTSPHMVYSPPEKFIREKDTRTGELHFAQFVSEVLHTNIIVHRPFDLNTFFTYFGVTFAFLLVVKKRGQRIKERLGKYYFWCLLSILSILISVSGYNFATQRQVPFLARNAQGQVMYLSGGTQYQFGSEMLISTGFYVLLGINTALLVAGTPRIKDESKRSVVILVLTASLFILYCMLATVFQTKDSDYPYVPLRIPIF